MHVTRVRTYPVKSFAGRDVDSARVLPWGLADDRRWAVIDPDGEPVTARQSNTLLDLTADVSADGELLLSDSSGSDGVRVAVPIDATAVPVGHSRQGSALRASSDAHDWLSRRLGRSVRLVWQPDPRVRPVDAADGGHSDDRMSLADSAPLLLTSQSSLAQLDRWTDEATPPLDMIRFRPNVVVDGDPLDPFAEDGWPFVQLGDVRFRVSGVCDRCVMTTIDPVTLTRGKEPIRTLARYRRWDGKTWFGVWIVPDLASSPPDAVVRVGDTVVPG